MAAEVKHLPGGWSFLPTVESDMDAKGIYTLFRPDGRHYRDENDHPIMSHAGPALDAFVEAMSAPASLGSLDRREWGDDCPEVMCPKR